jgi:hypothetical protein
VFSNFTFNVLTSQTCFVLDFPNHHAAQAHLEQDSTDDERDTDPSESFKAQMDKMYSSLVWRSSNYKLISEYANSMCLSDSSTTQLLSLVRS